MGPDVVERGGVWEWPVGRRLDNEQVVALEEASLDEVGVAEVGVAEGRSPLLAVE